MPMTEDLAQFFDVAEFGQQAVLDHVEVTGIFDRGYRDAFAGGAAGGMAVQEPTLTLRSSDCTRTRIGSLVRVVDVGSYRVAAIEPDGTGVTVLRLERAA